MEYPEMRRKNREVSREEALEMLVGCCCGVMATVSEEGQCYGVPVNYVVVGESIYIHGAPTGVKIDNIAYNPNVSFTVVAKAEVVPAKFATLYESAVAFGSAFVVEDIDEKKSALRAICEKYSEDFMEEAEIEIAKSFQHTKIIRIDIKHLTGKACRSIS